MSLWNQDRTKKEFLRDYYNIINKHLSIAFEGIILNGFKVKPDMEPRLHGYWGDEWAHTMQHQSCLLGIPSMQLEIPMSVRKLLNNDAKLRYKFTQAIVNI